MQYKIILRNLLSKKISHTYKQYYLSLLKRNNIPNIKVENENEWSKKWIDLGYPDPIYYRLFSHYIGNNIDIIPEDICRNVVEPILDPAIYVPYYSDKNIFDKLFKPGSLAKTILRKMDGFYYDAQYNHMPLSEESQFQKILSNSGIDKIVIKPTVNSSSGNGVRIFQYKDDKWQDLASTDVLTLEYLNGKYGQNFIIQECLEQASFMSYFNPSSVNTLRLSLYKSVKTDKCHITSAIIRIGKNGSLIDNAHAGGGYVGIKLDGTLCNKVLNQYGETIANFNGIDFTKSHKIPNWDNVISFAKYIGSCIPHHRLLALDIMIDSLGQPRLIEFNCEAYSMWLFQFTTGAAFGEYTNEIIEYCKNKLTQAQKIIKL